MNLSFKKRYNERMAVRSFEDKDQEGKPILIVEFSGDQFDNLKALEKHLKLDETQDVVRLALNLLVKMSFKSGKSDESKKSE